MGRRSRKRGAPATRDEPATRAERDAVRRERRQAARPDRSGRPSATERPPAPWGNFPLSELVIFVGIVVILWGAFSGGDQGPKRVAGGLVLASLGGGELALREHLAGFRSHSTLLAGVAAFAVVTVVALGLGPLKLWVLTVVGLLVFAATLYAMRQLFKRRSGGISFR
jgi:hypothetical protein